jgi:hypothetical protein
MSSGMKDTIGGPEKVRKTLAGVLPKVWDSISLSSLRGVHMPSRVCNNYGKRLVHQVLGCNHNTPGPLKKKIFFTMYS